MSSLRNRLLTGIIGGMILLLTVFSLLVYVVISNALVKQFDTSLISIAQILAASVELDNDEIDIEFDAEQMPEFQNPEHPTHYQLWRADGTVVTKSPLLGTDDLFRPDGTVKAPIFRTSRDKNDRPQRAVCLKFVPRIANSDEEDTNVLQPVNEQILTLSVARYAGDLHSQLRFLRWLLLIASAAVITLSLLIASIVVKQGLRPVNSIAAEIASIRVDNLTTRIGAQHVPTEIVPIKNRLNDLLSRLEASFNRERQFNADVAHELRTPLAGIRSTIEVTLARNRDTIEYREALSSCLEITQKIQSMVNNLLMLTRLDAKQISFKTEQIKLAEMVNSCWRSFCNEAVQRKITFENRIDAEFTVESEPEYMSMVFTNLLDNAVEYTEDGGDIWTTARRTNDSIELEFSNTGCELTTGQVSQVFDSFWRSDSSRSDAGTHCGLGLALVQRLAKALGGCATARLQPGGVFTIRLSFPVRLVTSKHPL